MSTHTEIRDEDLQRFIDGDLDDTSRQRVEMLVEADPALRGLVAGYRADKARLRALYSAGLNEPLPHAWIERIEDATARRPWQRQVWGITALAASVVLVLSAVIGLRQFSQAPRDDIVADAMAARSDAQQPDGIVSVSSPQAAATEAAVMTRVLDTRVKAPDLSRMGYKLVGIDTYSAPARSFELRYADASGRLFTLYLRRSSGTPRFDLLKQNGMRVCVWQDDVIGTVMAGPMSAAEMMRLASLAYTGMTL